MQTFINEEPPALLFAKEKLINLTAAQNPQQEEEEIFRFLQDAYHDIHKISIQLNFLENGNHHHCLTGIVRGISETEVIYLEANKSTMPIKIDSIRSVQVNKQ